MKVFVNGVFDLLHPGHFNLLMFARTMADQPQGRVIVALDEDEKVMIDKNIRRPIFNIHERSKALLDLRIGDRPVVDEVEWFYTNLQLEHLIRKHKPDYLVKGSDWRDKLVVGAQYTKVLFYDRIEYSTTDIVRRVLEKHNTKL